MMRSIVRTCVKSKSGRERQYLVCGPLPRPYYQSECVVFGVPVSILLYFSKLWGPPLSQQPKALPSPPEIPDVPELELIIFFPREHNRIKTKSLDEFSPPLFGGRSSDPLENLISQVILRRCDMVVNRTPVNRRKAPFPLRYRQLCDIVRCNVSLVGPYGRQHCAWTLYTTCSMRVCFLGQTVENCLCGIYLLITVTLTK